MSPQLCLIEDDALMGESLTDRFRLEGYAVDWHRTTRDAQLAFERRRYDAVLSDIRLADGDGGDLFLDLAGRQTSLPCLPPFVFITGYGSIDRAVELVKAGAADYVTKPFDLDRLVDKIQHLCEHSPRRAAQQARDSLGVSPAMRRIADALPRLASHAQTLLITGESGVGKEFFARAFHRAACAAAKGGDKPRPFVAVNCAALPEGLMEAELFGHERGAFTGAAKARRGVFEQASGGTLFLDEIGDMPLAMQAKLLRVLQDRRVCRLGSEQELEIDIRLVCATHRDLKAMVEQGAFRADLLFRLDVIHLRIPPLRERREDIAFHLHAFVDAFNAHHPDEPKRVDPRAENLLLRYDWPGNVRELGNAVERACVLSSGPVLRPDVFFTDALAPAREAVPEFSRSLTAYLAEVEREFIHAALIEHDWQIQRTADALGISRKTLWDKMRKLGLQPPAEAAG